MSFFLMNFILWLGLMRMPDNPPLPGILPVVEFDPAVNRGGSQSCQHFGGRAEGRKIKSACVALWARLVRLDK